MTNKKKRKEKKKTVIKTNTSNEEPFKVGTKNYFMRCVGKKEVPVN